MVRLSVNVNKIATLRNSRGGTTPDVLEAAQCCIQAGCHGITVHPRPDRRHIWPEDVLALAPLVKHHGLEYNIEGNPFSQARNDYPGFVALCHQARADQATLVPDSDGQLTSNQGFDLKKDGDRLAPVIKDLNQDGIRVSLFMDAGSPDIARAADLGADRVELYTGPFAEAFHQGQPAKALALLAKTAEEARQAGLGVNAGHDLSQANLGLFLQSVPGITEVSIGHAIICEALYEGLAKTIGNYLTILQSL